MQLKLSESLKQHLNDRSRSVQVEIKKRVNHKKPTGEGFLDQPKEVMPVNDPPRTKTTRELGYERFIDRHRRLMNSLDKQPCDVKWLAQAVNKVGRLQVGAVHFYVDVRSFLVAHSGGFCSLVDVKIRNNECVTCNWAYSHKEHRYCRGCTCPNWPASRLTHKVKLAKFICPQGRFDKAKGWISRFLTYIWG